MIRIIPNLGKPWTAKNEDAYIESRFLVIQILMTFAIQQWKIQSVVNLRGANPDIFYFTPAFTSNNNNLHEGMPLGMVYYFSRHAKYLIQVSFKLTLIHFNGYKRNA